MSKSKVVQKVTSLVMAFAFIFSTCFTHMQGIVKAATNGEVEAGIFVEKVEGLTDDFINGVDISTLLAEEASGVVYYKGVNYVRVRVWNDPYADEAKTQGYGAGNCTIETAKEIGLRAQNYGIKLMVDFHYSDFWADPAKYQAPKAWEDMTFTEKETALYDYTKESMEYLVNSGVEVAMVQVGNETISGIAGESGFSNICKLLKQGCQAVRDVDSSIQIALHFTDVHKGRYSSYAQQLQDAGVDYDIFASSYYAFWHGTLENLTSELTKIRENYGKQVMVAETSFAYTDQDLDGHPNVIDSSDAMEAYPFTVQGQANAIRDVYQATVDAGGIGVFYWEPAWIPVNVYDAEAEDASEVLAKNQQAWETYGSGWASSYTLTYNESNYQTYGGSEWDNQALFDAYGHPLESLNIYEYMKTGAYTNLEILSVETPVVSNLVGEKVEMPAKVTVNFNDGSSQAFEATWNQTDIDHATYSGIGSYTISGSIEVAGVTRECTALLVIVGENLVTNPSFESGSTGWTITGNGASVTSDDPKSGSKSLHYWASDAVQFTAEQTLTGLENGYYEVDLSIQG